MKKKIISAFLCVLLPCTTAFRVSAEDRVKIDGLSSAVGVITVPDTDDDVGAALSPMRKGNKAPFSGVLLSPVAVAQIVAQMRFVEEEKKLEVERAKEEAAAWSKHEMENQKIFSETKVKIMQAEIDYQFSQVKKLQEDLSKAESERPNKYLWAGLGVLGGVGLALLTVYAVK